MNKRDKHSNPFVATLHCAIVMDPRFEQESKMEKLREIVTMVAGAFAIFSIILAVYQAMQKEIASAGLLATIFLVCTLVVFIPQLESLKAWGIEARLRQTVNEAVATLDNLKRLSATSAKSTYLSAAWSNRIGAPTAKEKQAVLDETEKQLAELKISEEERREIVRPYVQMIGFDFYMLYVRIFDRYLNWRSDELMRRYNAGNSPEAKKALDEFREKPGKWRSLSLRSGMWRDLDSSKLKKELDQADPSTWLAPSEIKAAEELKAEVLGLFKACESKGGYTPEAADFYDTYHDTGGQDLKIKEMFGVNPSDVR